MVHWLSCWPEVLIEELLTDVVVLSVYSWLLLMVLLVLPVLRLIVVIAGAGVIVFGSGCPVQRFPARCVVASQVGAVFPVQVVVLACRDPAGNVDGLLVIGG